MTPDRAQLGGLDYPTAKLYGMPHISAFYRNSSIDSHKAEQGAYCPVCGKPATNVHHCPPKGKGRVFLLQTPWGKFALRPALMALCGDGVRGCHGAIHQRLTIPDWEWFDERDEEAWWNGFLLSHGFQPHDKRLYGFGRWVFRKDGRVVAEWRG